MFLFWAITFGLDGLAVRSILSIPMIATETLTGVLSLHCASVREMIRVGKPTFDRMSVHLSAMLNSLCVLISVLKAAVECNKSLRNHSCSVRSKKGAVWMAAQAHNFTCSAIALLGTARESERIDRFFSELESLHVRERSWASLAWAAGFSAHQQCHPGNGLREFRA